MKQAYAPKTPPASGVLSADLITRQLRDRELLRLGGVILLLLLGFPALLAGPIILSSLYWIIGLLWFIYVPWTWVFLGSLALLVPLLFWTEWRSGGAYYSDAMRETYSPSDGPQVLMVPFINTVALLGTSGNPRVSAIWLTEMFLWGPRQILEAIHSIRRMRLFVRVDRNQSAQLLQKLLKSNSADLGKLFPNCEADAARTVGYLVWYDWIGASKENGKIWLESHSRMVLEKQAAG